MKWTTEWGQPNGDKIAGNTLFGNQQRDGRRSMMATLYRVACGVHWGKGIAAA